MSPIGTVLLVARRELLERARSSAFLASTAVTVLIVGAAILLPSAMFEPGTQRVGLVAPPSGELAQLVVSEGERLELTVETRAMDDAAAAEAALRDGELEVVVVDGRTLVWEAEEDPQLDAVIRSAIMAAALRSRAAETGMDPEELAALLTPPAVTARSLEPVDPNIEGRREMATIAMLVLFIGIAMYGTFVLTGVVEEKSSRVVEVLLARMPPRHLLAGKILGIGTLGLFQITVTVVLAMVALRVAGQERIDLPSLSAGLAAWLVLWFVLGYAVYSTAYGALGALASRMEDAQSATGPLTAVLVVSYWATLVAVMGESDWATLLVTLLPITSPMAVPMRTAAGELPVWEGVAALVLMGAAIYGMLLFAGRVYSGAVLRTGRRVRVRDAWRGSAA